MTLPVIIVSVKRVCLISLVAAVVITLLFIIPVYITVKINAPVTNVICGKTIIIDPGHGGDDPGAQGCSGLLEKDVVLDISLRLADLFSRAAVYTVLTRDTDGWLDLEDRIELIRSYNADIYISVHANSFPEPIWSGAQTFYFSKSEEAKSLAVFIQRELAGRLGPNVRKVKPGDDYFVLRKSSVPAVIVEVGFLSNPREEALLAQKDYRRRVAEAIFYGTVNYFSSVPDLHTED